MTSFNNYRSDQAAPPASENNTRRSVYTGSLTYTMSTNQPTIKTRDEKNTKIHNLTYPQAPIK